MTTGPCISVPGIGMGFTMMSAVIFCTFSAITAGPSSAHSAQLAPPSQQCSAILAKIKSVSLRLLVQPPAM
ncbi:hypothetical protein KC342_g103 [Hortaea werneckii]|nr:hypothetical protein KC342_g103 [Hortaea werneckii]